MNAMAPAASPAMGDPFDTPERRALRHTVRRFVEREVLPSAGLVIDGGRTIRDREGERFTVSLDPQKPARIVIRTGGQPSYNFHEVIAKPITLKLFAENKELGHITLAAPSGQFSEIVFNIPVRALHSKQVEVHTEASAPYRVFHWFVLQTDAAPPVVYPR